LHIIIIIIIITSTTNGGGYVIYTLRLLIYQQDYTKRYKQIWLKISFRKGQTWLHLWVIRFWWYPN